MYLGLMAVMYSFKLLTSFVSANPPPPPFHHSRMGLVMATENVPTSELEASLHLESKHKLADRQIVVHIAQSLLVHDVNTTATMLTLRYYVLPNPSLIFCNLESYKSCSLDHVSRCTYVIKSRSTL